VAGKRTASVRAQGGRPVRAGTGGVASAAMSDRALHVHAGAAAARPTRRAARGANTVGANQSWCASFRTPAAVKRIAARVDAALRAGGEWAQAGLRAGSMIAGRDRCARCHAAHVAGSAVVGIALGVYAQPIAGLLFAVAGESAGAVLAASVYARREGASCTAPAAVPWIGLERNTLTATNGLPLRTDESRRSIIWVCRCTARR
jgi:hypothetical protein